MRPMYECPEKFLHSLTMTTETFPEFLRDFLAIDAMNMRTKVEVRSFPCS